MKIGFPNHPRKDIMEEVKWIAKNGFDFIDLFLEPDRAHFSNIDGAALKELLDGEGLGRIGHTAWFIPIGSPMPELREAAIEILQRHIDFFEGLGCNKMTVHANWPPGLFATEEGVEFQIDSLNRLVEYAKGSGLRIMYEPINGKQDNKRNIDRILEQVPGLLLLADIGHFNLFNRKPVTYLKHYEHEIAHIHMHDNDGLRDLHLPLGSGNIRWPALVDSLKSFYDGTITLEVFSDDKRHVLKSKRYLEELWQK